MACARDRNPYFGVRILVIHECHIVINNTIPKTTVSPNPLVVSDADRGGEDIALEEYPMAAVVR